MTNKTDIPLYRSFALRVLTAFMEDYRRRFPERLFTERTFIIEAFSIEENQLKFVNLTARSRHGDRFVIELTINSDGPAIEANVTIWVLAHSGNSRLAGVVHEDATGAITLKMLAAAP